MARYTIANDAIEIMVSSHGAEMKSLRKLNSPIEYLWYGDSTYWKRNAPVLFPFVGGLNEKTFRIDGKTYPMNQHGFARDMSFQLLSQNYDSLWMELKSNEETLALYPYDFILRIGYELNDHTVKVTWEVENNGDKDLPFSIGGHPGFICPIDKSLNQSDYLLHFDAEALTCTCISDKGLALPCKKNISLTDGYLPITEHLFDEDALIPENFQATTISICRPDKSPYITLKTDAPLFGVWSPPKQNAPFICIEPWYGRCDEDGYTGELKDRKWGNLISPGETWKRSYEIILH